MPGQGEGELHGGGRARRKGFYVNRDCSLDCFLNKMGVKRR